MWGFAKLLPITQLSIRLLDSVALQDTAVEMFQYDNSDSHKNMVCQNWCGRILVACSPDLAPTEHLHNE